MLSWQPVGLVCPYCGLLFFTDYCGIIYSCPGCRRRWKVSDEEMLEASLGEE
ncbi:MAG: hypothetical protein KAT58_11060 [candidate division Zixibacteria bacterium]|nr:hypothetical protein [candidate division Zixibacteria bacterium]